MLKKHKALAVALSLILTLACGPLDLAREILGGLAASATPTASFAVFESSVWYVTKEGNDANTCDSPEQACLTIAEAIDRADDDDIINIGAGIFVEDSGAGQALRITERLVLRGVGEAETILDSEGLRGGIFVSGDANAVIRNLTVRNAAPGAPGHCISIRNEASARIEDVKVENCAPNGIEHLGTGEVSLVNVTVTGAQRAGVYAGGQMVIEGGRFHANTSSGILSITTGRLDVTGALVENNDADGLTLNGLDVIRDSVIRDNGLVSANHSGVGIGGNATLTNVIIYANDYGIRLNEGAELTMTGGEIHDHFKVGLEVREGASARLTDVVLRANGRIFGETSIPGHIQNYGTLLLVRSVLADSTNGALLNFETGNFVLRESSIIGNGGSLAALFNHAGGVGIVERSLFADNPIPVGTIDNRGSLSLINTTVTGAQGVAISAGTGSLSLSYVTIADNDGVGLAAHNGAAGVSRVENSLIARNGVSDCSISTAAGVVPLPLSGVNIDSDGTCRFGLTYAPVDLLLDTLADNGGFTQTMALLVGSPAIEAATGSCPATDQRGSPFSRPFGPACDVGAYEGEGAALSLDATVEFATETPTPDVPDQPMLTINTDTPCYSGPGPNWAYLRNIQAGLQLDLVGYGFQPGWFVARHPTAQGVLCWLAERDVTPNVPIGDLRLIAIPPRPTATPGAPKPTDPAPRDTDVPPSPTPCDPINDPNNCP